jgi:hypothetical protein
MKEIVALLGSVALLCSLVTPCAAADPVAAGLVKIASGEATVVRGGEAIPATPGLRIMPGDTLRTGSDGRIGVIFRDDAMLSLGPDTVMVLESYLFAPAESRLSFLGRIVRGTVAYLSGVIVKLSPGAARFETPVASIGLRGTRVAIEVQP